MPIMLVETEDEAVELANDSEFGLGASVWGNDSKRIEAIARDLNVGTVTVNDCLVTHAMPQVPWGGRGSSGIGRSHSHFGLVDLVNVKHISTDFAGGAYRMWWHPYGKGRLATARGGLKFLHGTLFAKLGGLLKFLTNSFSHKK